MARRLADWGNLPKELATKIAEHIDWYEDFESFSWVCSCWRSATKEANLRACVVDNTSPFSSLSHEEHRLPWLLLPKENDNSLQRRLYSLSKNMSRHISLPNRLANESEPDSTHGSHDRIKLLSSHGWLFMATSKYYSNYTPILLNPLSGTTIELPRMSLSCGPFRWMVSYDYVAHLFHKFILSANPFRTSDFTVFLSIGDTCANSFYSYYGNEPIFAYWRNGDHEWSVVPHIDLHFRENCCEDITYYQGYFYALFRSGHIVQFRTAQGDHYHLVVGRFNGKRGHTYLVESAGKLLIIKRTVSRNHLTTNFEVYDFDFETGEFTQVHSLGNRSIFIGANSSFSMDVTLAPGFKPNCIYYTHDYYTPDYYSHDYLSMGNCVRGNFRGKDNGVYSLENGKSELHLSLKPEPHYVLTPITWVESF